jgi:hypothetical protein
MITIDVYFHKLLRPLSHDKLPQYVTCHRKLEILPSFKFNLDVKCLGSKKLTKETLNVEG